MRVRIACSVASASADGGKLMVSRGYTSMAGGHLGHVWTLTRAAGVRPPPSLEYRHGMAAPIFCSAPCNGA